LLDLYSTASSHFRRRIEPRPPAPRSNDALLCAPRCHLRCRRRAGGRLRAGGRRAARCPRPRRPACESPRADPRPARAHASQGARLGCAARANGVKAGGRADGQLASGLAASRVRLRRGCRAACLLCALARPRLQASAAATSGRAPIAARPHCAIAACCCPPSASAGWRTGRGSSRLCVAALGVCWSA
jgi:hypothetical protein